MSSYPEAYLSYLVHFHGDRDYFECHELLEEHWKSTPASERSPVWVGLIQLAVAQYHHRRGNRAGAQKMLQSARRILAAEHSRLQQLGLDPVHLLALIEERLAALAAQQPYRSVNLPLQDQALLDTCRRRCAELRWTWCGESNLNDRYLLNKHALRDRSEVIAERERRLRAKAAGSADQDKR